MVTLVGLLATNGLENNKDQGVRLVNPSHPAQASRYKSFALIYASDARGLPDVIDINFNFWASKIPINPTFPKPSYKLAMSRFSPSLPYTSNS